MPLAVSRGVLLHYRVLYGNGPPLLMLRGLSRPASYWMGLEDMLARSFTVIVMDNRGVGRSSKPPGLWTVEDMADDTAAVIRAAGFETVNLFGMSLGGMIAQETVLRYPGMVSRLVLGCTTPGPGKGRRTGPLAIAGLLAAVALPLEFSNKLVVRLTLSERARRSGEIERAWLELGRREPVSRLSVVKQMLAALGHEAGDRLEGIHCPTLVITGTDDFLIHRKNSEVLADSIPGARLEYIEGAGHDFPAEQPELTARLIKDFCIAGAGNEVQDGRL